MLLMSCVGLNSILDPVQEHVQYETVKRLSKKGQEFCRTVNSILEERAELDSFVAKSLSKMSTKLSKTASNSEGALADLCNKMAVQLESEAEVHRWMSETITSDICSPCKELHERHCRTKKHAEGSVDKQLKTFVEKRSEEIKSRKLAFSLAREGEETRELLRCRCDNKGKQLTEKDVKKLLKKMNSINLERDKLDHNYWNGCQRVEIARQDWELSIKRAITQMREAEEERIRRMNDYLTQYSHHLSQLGPKISKTSAVLEEALKHTSIEADLQTVIQEYRTEPEQLTQPILPTFYAETLENRMDPGERRKLLVRYLSYAQSDLSREVRGREGVEKLVSVYRTSPNFGDTEVQQEVNDKLQQVKKMIEYIEASQFKISAALFLLDVSPDSGRTIHSLQTESRIPEREVAGSDPQSSEEVSRDFDESDYRDSFYSFQTEEVSRDLTHDVETFNSSQINDIIQKGETSQPKEPYGPKPPSVLCHCRVLYDFCARQDDELSLRIGEIVRVYCKQTSDWWFGEKVSGRGSAGLFPSIYVEEISDNKLGLTSYV